MNFYWTQRFWKIMKFVTSFISNLDLISARSTLGIKSEIADSFKIFLSNFKIDASAFSFEPNGKIIGVPAMTSTLKFSNFQKYFEKPKMPIAIRNSVGKMPNWENAIHSVPGKSGSSKKRKQNTQGLIHKFRRLDLGNFSRKRHFLSPS